MLVKALEWLYFLSSFFTTEVIIPTICLTTIIFHQRKNDEQIKLLDVRSVFLKQVLFHVLQRCYRRRYCSGAACPLLEL